MSRRALVIQHDHVSPLGPVGARLADRGYELVFHQVVDEEHFLEPNIATRFPGPASVDLIVSMGAPWSTYDRQTIGAWSTAERALLRAADKVGTPVLGICFGGQMLALAHGGTVGPSPDPEIGWIQIDTTDEALVPPGPWFQWHFDSWTIPPGATEIARTPAASQAFALRRNLAVQFHPELTPTMLSLWLDAGGDSQVRANGRDPDELMRNTEQHHPAARDLASRLVDGFLDRIADSPTELPPPTPHKRATRR